MKFTKITAITLISGLLSGLILGRFFMGESSTHDHADHAVPAEGENPAKPTVWTCSMHPQIKLPKPGKCPICFMDLIPLEASDEDVGGLREIVFSDNAKKLMELETSAVERKFVAAQVRMVGKVDYDETKVSEITAWVSGRIDRLFVDYTGVPVRKGDHMVELYSPELLSAQEELLQALKSKNNSSGALRDMTQSTIDSAREKLRLWGLAPEQIKQIETRGKASDNITIYAPAGGIVVTKHAQEGMYINTGMKIYTIADLSQVWVRLDAYESDLIWLRYGQKVEFTSEAYPGATFRGTISFIDPVLTQTTRTVKVRVNVANPEMRLKPGMFVRAVVKADVAAGGKVMDAALAGKWICPMHPDEIKDKADKCGVCGMPLVRTESLGYVGVAADSSAKPLVIPVAAALITGTRAVVYVEAPGKDKPTYEGREIVLGPRAGDYYIVNHGLEEGERVVTRGAFKIDAELQIQAKPSMMTPEGGGGGMAHDHGGAAAEASGDEHAGHGEKTAKGPILPFKVKAQLQEVVEAITRIAQASTADSPEVDEIRGAYGALIMKIRGVDAAALTGHPAMLWKEHSMLLTNDAMEGGKSKQISDLKRIAASARQHGKALSEKMGLEAKKLKQPPSPLDPKFMDQLGGVVDAYLEIRRALAADDALTAVASAVKGLDALSKVDMKLLKGDDHMDWMEHLQELQKTLTAVSKAKEIEPVRQEFALLSEQMIATLARFGNPGPNLMHLFCPMAFNSRGANWLQEKEPAGNPYFGDAMLRCGELVNNLEPVKTHIHEK